MAIIFFLAFAIALAMAGFDGWGWLNVLWMAILPNIAYIYTRPQARGLLLTGALKSSAAYLSTLYAITVLTVSMVFGVGVVLKTFI